MFFQFDAQMEIFEYISKGNKKAVVCLTQDPNFNPKIVDASGNTPLFAALFEENAELTKILLKKQSDPNLFHAEKNIFPMHAAAHSSDSYLCELLCDYGAEINCLDDDDITPLFLSIISRNYETTRFLLLSGASLIFSDASPEFYFEFFKNEDQSKMLKIIQSRVKIELFTSSWNDNNRKKGNFNVMTKRAFVRFTDAINKTF